MTNVDELFNQLVDLGQHPKQKADTVTILEKIGHFLDEANDKIYYKNKRSVIINSLNEYDTFEILIPSKNFLSTFQIDTFKG